MRQFRERVLKTGFIMRKILSMAFACGLVFGFPAVASAEAIITIRGQDGAFLGTVNSNRIDNESICNRISDYGSRIGDKSIFNRISDYGSQISDYSAYNPNASNPPVLYNGTQPHWYVTKNRRFNSEETIDPDVLLAGACERQ
jgi:hypothetical protein